MGFDPEMAAIRFGCGLSPQIPAPQSVEEMLARLAGPDRAAQAFAIPGFAAMEEYNQKLRAARRALKAAGEAGRKARKKDIQQVRRDAFRAGAGWFGHMLLRRALAEDGFRERLCAFWADHFTAAGRQRLMRAAVAPYAEEAIRPHVAGRFSQMLRAAETHPLMLIYLDQRVSVGPNSKRAQRAGGDLGLNENLAREMLELHTLGVGAPYTQTDVRQLAKLLTGLTYTGRKGVQFRPAWAEPGAETVLGHSYGGDKARLEDIYAFFDDLANHPATAAHLARKLAVHFVSDSPDEGMVADMAARYRETGGNLPDVYAVMLGHPAAWRPQDGNVKEPMDFIGSALRALAVAPGRMPADNLRRMQRLFLGPLELMGQNWGRPGGPDGLPEEDADWITPQRLAARLQWAVTVPSRLQRVLPDPRAFVDTALGARARGAVRFAAGAAETRAEGIGLILAAPEFQRM